MHNSGRMMLTIPANALFDLSRNSGAVKKMAEGYLAAGNESADQALRSTSEVLRDLKL